MLKVVSHDLIEVGIVKVFFEGSREACYAYMRKNGGRNPAKKFDLMYSESGRLASWML